MNAIRYQRTDEPKSKVKLSDIRTNGGTQSRVGMNPSVVDEYAAAMLDGAEFPRMVIFYDGAHHWLADGFHRHAAYLKADIAVVEADVRQGSQRDAILFSVGANSSHGLQRTRDDKRRAVLTLLQDAEWSLWSDREIARRCAVSDFLVRSLRENRSEERLYTTKHGTVSTMQTANIGSPKLVDDDTAAVIPQKARDIAGADDDEEITAEDLAADPGFQRVTEQLQNAKALLDEALAMPAAEPVTPEKEELWRRAFGTPEIRSDFMDIINATKLVDQLPNPDEMARLVPPTMAHAVDVLAILNLSTWFEQFARAWERREGASV